MRDDNSTRGIKLFFIFIGSLMFSLILSPVLGAGVVVVVLALSLLGYGVFYNTQYSFKEKYEEYKNNRELLNKRNDPPRIPVGKTVSDVEEEELFARLSQEIENDGFGDYDPPIPLEWDSFNPVKLLSFRRK